MVQVTFDSRNAEAKIKRLQEHVLIGADIGSETGAIYLKRDLEGAVPVITGRLRRSFRTVKLGNKWFVSVRSRDYPGFFYAILHIPLFARIVLRKKSVIRRIMGIRFSNYMNQRIRNANR